MNPTSPPPDKMFFQGKKVYVAPYDVFTSIGAIFTAYDVDELFSLVDLLVDNGNTINKILDFNDKEFVL